MSSQRSSKVTGPLVSTAAWSQTKRSGLGAMLLTGVCLAVYANALPNPFHRDDVTIILRDPRVGGFQARELLTGNYWYLGDTDRLYRPLVLLSYAANWAISQEPWTFRVPNLALHAGVCITVLALIRRVYGSYRAALIGALLFAVHPLHTEPLNAVVGRADLLVTLFVLGAAVLYWDDASTDKGGLWRPLAAAGLFAGGLLCKENAVTLPGLVALLDWWRGRRGNVPDLRPFLARRVLRCYLPMLLLIGGYLLLRWHLFGMLAAGTDSINFYDNPIAHPTQGLEEGDSAVLARWATPLATLAKAVQLHLVPQRLCIDYSYAAIETVRRLNDGRLWMGLGWLAAGGAVCLVSYRLRLGLEVAILFSAVTYFIVSNIPIVIGTIFGERLLYLPSVGYCMMFGLLVHLALGKEPDAPSRRRLARGGLGTLLAGVVALVALWYGYLTIDRNRDWRSSRALCVSAYRVNPRSCKVLAGMADVSLGDGELRQALEYCDAATKIAPRYGRAWRTIALTFRRLAQQSSDPREKEFLTEQALAYFRHTFDLGAGGHADVALGFAALLVERGEYGTAIHLLEQFVGYRPREAQAFDALARYLLEAQPVELRDPRRALQCIRRAMELRPEIANYVVTLADALLALGRPAEAADAIRQVIPELPPDSPGVDYLSKRLEQIEKQHAPDPGA